MASDATKQTISQSLNELKKEVAERTKSTITGIKIPELQETLLFSPTDRLIMETDSGTRKATLSNFGRYFGQGLASPQELVDAREDGINNVLYNTLKERLDSQFEKVDNTILEKTRPNHISVYAYGIKEGLNVDVVENTRNFQRMINECANNKVIVFPAGDFVFNEINLGEKNNISIMGVSNSFASMANKDINTAAITNTFTRIICNSDKGKTFFNHKSCVLVLSDISFYNLKKDVNGTFLEEPAKTNILMQHTRSATADRNTEKGKVFATNCGFFGWKVCFGSEFTLQDLENELGSGLVEGNYDYLKQTCVVANRCRFTRNAVPINLNVDGRLVDCSFNSNDYAMIFRQSSGFTTIDSCRIEWNNRNGIYAEKAHDITISNSEFDRNGKAGLYIVDCTNSNVNGGVFRRNGAKVTGDTAVIRDDYENNVHIYARNNVNCNFIGVNTVVKAILDTGASAERPTNCSGFFSNRNCIISLNNFTGCTKGDKADANKFNSNTTCVIENNIIN